MKKLDHYYHPINPHGSPFSISNTLILYLAHYHAKILQQIHKFLFE